MVGIRKLIVRHKWKKVLIKLFFLLLFFEVSYFHTQKEIEFRNNYYSAIKNDDESFVWGKLYRKELKTYGYVYYLKDCYVSLSEENIPCNKILVYIDQDDYSIGNILKIGGKIKKFNRATNEGQFDVESFYLSQKIDFSIKADKVERLNENGFSIGENLYGIKNKLTTSILQISGEKAGGILSSMLWGNKSLMDSDIKDLYTDSGIAHILAISGLHVSMIGMGFYRFLRNRRLSFLNAGIFAGIIIICYGIMSGGAVSTERACGMFVISVFAAYIGRSYDLLSALGLMIIIILWQNVFAIFYAGFVFSVVAILGIGIIVKIFETNDEEEEENKHIIRDSLLSAIGIQLTTIPIVAYYYYEIPIYSMFLNMIVLSLLEYLFVSGLTGAIIGIKFVGLARIIIIPAKVILSVYQFLCQMSMRLPLSQYIVGRPEISEIVFYYILLGMFAGLIYVNRKKYLLLKLFIFLTMLAIIVIPNKKEVQFDVLDVGQGLGIYGNSGDGIGYFIDGGSSSDEKIGDNVILPFLKYKGIRKIAYWFVTHTDNDHISGLCTALENGYKIDNLVIYEGTVFDEAFEKLNELAMNNDTNIIYMKCNDVIKTDNIEISCINQQRTVYDDSNDMCLCLRIKYNNEDLSITVCGDISDNVEKEMLSDNKIEPSDVYIVNHHGSKFSSSKEFVRAINPKLSIISCASKNKYGHPAREAVKRIEECDSSIRYTMKEGQISLY